MSISLKILGGSGEWGVGSGEWGVGGVQLAQRTTEDRRKADLPTPHTNLVNNEVMQSLYRQASVTI